MPDPKTELVYDLTVTHGQIEYARQQQANWAAEVARLEAVMARLLDERFPLPQPKHQAA